MRPLPLLVLVFTLAFVASGYFFPFDGYDTGQVPIPQPDPPVQPAGWAFSIWGLIYLGLIVSAIVGVFARADDPDWDAVRGPLLASLIVGTPWLAVAQRSAIWASVMIVVMAVLAIWAASRAPERDRWLLRAPVGLYAGWLTAASFVSWGSTAGGFGWLTPEAAAYLFVGGAVAAALIVQSWLGRVPTFAVAAGWGLFGIAAKNAGTLPVLSAGTAAGIVLLAAVAWWRWREGPAVRLV